MKNEKVGIVSGHTQGYLREAFAEYIDEHNRRGSSPMSLNDKLKIGYNENEKPFLWLCGVLWNCTDIMPSLLCDEIDLPQGSTYAQGARKLRREFK